MFVAYYESQNHGIHQSLNTFPIKTPEGKAPEKSAQPEGIFKEILDRQSLMQAEGKASEHGAQPEGISKEIIDRQSPDQSEGKIYEDNTQPGGISQGNLPKQSLGQDEESSKISPIDSNGESGSSVLIQNILPGNL
jgi:hypothetical protein